MMDERPLSVDAAKVALRYAARDAERARWRYIKLQDPVNGTPETYPSNAASNVDRAETTLFERYNMLTCFGVIDDDDADAIVAAERKRVREELDAEWLTPRTEDDGVPE